MLSDVIIIGEVMILMKRFVLWGLVISFLLIVLFGKNSFCLKNKRQAIARTAVKNDTEEIIYYSILLLSPGEEVQKKLINPGEIHYYPGYFALKITFSRNNRELIYRLNPGNIYVFKQDKFGKLDVFVNSEIRADYESPVPFVPTPSDIVREMLEIAGIKPEDVVYDLGSGDGRIVITAAREFGAQGVGVEIDTELVNLSKQKAAQAGVSDRVEFKIEDVFKSDISKASIVTIYMLCEVNEKLRSHLDNSLKKGSRVVTHNYPIPGWAENLIKIFSIRSKEDEEEHLIYFYKKH